MKMSQTMNVINDEYATETNLTRYNDEKANEDNGTYTDRQAN